MAKQEGIIKMKGRMGDFSFYKSKGEYYTRRKGGASANKIKNDPAFARVRENNNEFGRASTAGKLVRQAFSKLTCCSSFEGLSGRLTQTLLQVIKSDGINVRGVRSMKNGDLSVLRGFDMNEKAHFDNIFKPGYAIAGDYHSGYIAVTVPAFVPVQQLDYPKGATHIRIALGGAGIDFETGEFRTKVSGSATIPLDDSRQEGFKLAVNLSGETYGNLLGALAVEFYQEVNGKMNSFMSERYTAIKIVLAEKVDA